MKKKIIFTNGVFDILHVGHIRLLKKAKSLGDELIVGINSNISVRIIKGNKRPIIDEKDRKYILESIKYVDKVYIFHETTPYNLIKIIKPDIIVKGDDWNISDVVGNDIANVQLVDIKDNISTSKIIKSIIKKYR